MTNFKHKPVKEVFIGPIEVLTKNDMIKIYEPAFRPQSQMTKLKNSHHRLARLAAAGLQNSEISARTGYSENHLCALLNAPAMQELIAHYRKMVNIKFIESTDEYQSLSTSNMLLAEGMIADRLIEAEEAGTDLPIKDLLAISRDAADRNGYGKKSSVTHKTDFAEKLEQAIKRSREAQPKQVIQ